MVYCLPKTIISPSEMPGQLRFNRYNLIVRPIGARSTLFFYKKKKKLNETKQVKNTKQKQNNTKIRFLSLCTTRNKKTKRKKETLKLRVEC